MSEQQKAARRERAAEAGYPDGIISSGYIVSGAGVPVKPPSCALRREDYAAWWTARRRYLLAQAEVYLQR